MLQTLETLNTKVRETAIKVRSCPLWIWIVMNEDSQNEAISQLARQLAMKFYTFAGENEKYEYAS